MAVIMIIINHIQNAELELRNTLGIAIRAVHMVGGELNLLRPTKNKKEKWFYVKSKIK